MVVLSNTSRSEMLSLESIPRIIASASQFLTSTLRILSAARIIAPRLDTSCSLALQSSLQAMKGTSRVAEPRQSEPGTVEARRGTRPEHPPRAAGRKRKARRWPRRLVGPAGRARYSACVPGDRDATERTGPRGSGQVGWYREGLTQAPVPTVERRSARGAGAFV